MSSACPRPRSFIPIQDGALRAPDAYTPIGPPLARPVAVRAERQRDRADPRGAHTRGAKHIDESLLPRPRRHVRSLSYGDAQLRPRAQHAPPEGPVTLAPECLRSTQPSPSAAPAPAASSAHKRSFSPALSAASFGSAVTPSSEEGGTARSASPLPSDLSDLAEQQRRRVVGGGWARSPPRALSGAPRAASAQMAAGLAGSGVGIGGAGCDLELSAELATRVEHFKSHPELRWRAARPGSAPRKVFSYAPNPHRPPPAADDDEDDRPRPFPSVFASDRRFLRFLKRRWNWRRK